jgi:hypothetical protein
MGGGQNTTDSVEVEASMPCSALGANGYTVVEPPDEGKMPPNETCSPDPGSGFSHCETHRGSLWEKVATTALLAVPDAIMFACDAPAGASLTWLGLEATWDAYDWTRKE